MSNFSVLPLHPVLVPLEQEQPHSTSVDDSWYVDYFWELQASIRATFQLIQLAGEIWDATDQPHNSWSNIAIKVLQSGSKSKWTKSIVSADNCILSCKHSLNLLLSVIFPHFPLLGLMKPKIRGCETIHSFIKLPLTDSFFHIRCLNQDASVRCLRQDKPWMEQKELMLRSQKSLDCVGVCCQWRNRQLN